VTLLVVSAASCWTIRGTYQLGYYSDSTRWSRNKFMKIEVRVKRPDLQVRARKGYLPPDARAIGEAKEADVKAGNIAGTQGGPGEARSGVAIFRVRVFAAPLRGSSD
jgi:hypothetical protein